MDLNGAQTATFDVRSAAASLSFVFEVTLDGTWVHTIDAQGMMTVTYVYQTSSADIGGAWRRDGLENLPQIPEDAPFFRARR